MDFSSRNFVPIKQEDKHLKRQKRQQGKKISFTRNTTLPECYNLLFIQV